MRVLLLAALLLPGAGAWAQPRPRVTASATIDLSEGRYGEAVSTTILSSELAFKLRTGPWSARVAFSHLLIDGPSDIATTDGGGGRRRHAAVSGPGDTLLTATRSFDDLAGTPLYLLAVAKLRLPTGSARKGLGVGAVDAMLGGEAGWSAAKYGASFRLTRRFLGDPGYHRRDGWQVEAAAWIVPRPRLQIGVDYERRELAFAREPASRTVEGTVNYRLGRRLWLQVAAYRGLSSTAARRGVTVGATMRL